jgi:hypothetical protein
MLFQKLLGIETGPYSVAMGTPGRLSSAGTSASVGYPSGITAGDLLVIFGYIQGNTTANTPSGWSNTFNIPFDPCFTKIADGTETGSLTISWSGSFTAAIGMIRVKFGGTTPILINSVGSFGDDLSVTPASTRGNGRDFNLLVIGFGDAASTTASVTSPTPTANLFSNSARSSFFVWYWNNNTATISTVTSRTSNYRILTINTV